MIGELTKFAYCKKIPKIIPKRNSIPFLCKNGKMLIFMYIKKDGIFMGDTYAGGMSSEIFNDM